MSLNRTNTPLAKKFPKSLAQKINMRVLKTNRQSMDERHKSVQQRRDEILFLNKLRSQMQHHRRQSTRARRDVQQELSSLSKAHRASIRQERADNRRRQMLAQRMELAALHNRSVAVASGERKLERVVRSNLTALNSDMRVERADRRRQARIEQVATTAAARNRTIEDRVQLQENINNTRVIEKRREHQTSQISAENRRSELQLLKQSSAALHNERVELTKNYVKISDYIEEVDAEHGSECDAVEESQDAENSSYCPSDNFVDDGESAFDQAFGSKSTETGSEASYDLGDLGLQLIKFALSKEFRTAWAVANQ